MFVTVVIIQLYKKYRIAIKFCFNLGKSTLETFQMFNQTYGKSAKNIVQQIYARQNRKKETLNVLFRMWKIFVNTHKKIFK